MKVERMRAAILENLNVQFARPPLGLLGTGHFGNAPPAVPVPPPSSMGRGRGDCLFVIKIFIYKWRTFSIFGSPV